MIYIISTSMLFKIPFVCGARNLGEALRRIGEGAAMIRTKGEAGTGNVVEAVRHMRTMMGQIRLLQNLPREEWMSFAKEQGAPYELVAEVAAGGRLPVVNFAAGGIATPADAALMMKLGSEGVFVGSGIFRSGDPAKRAKAIVLATSYYNDPKIVAEVSEDLGEAMSGIDIKNYTGGTNLCGAWLVMQSVGVLALQGSFSEHLTKLAQLTEVLPVAVKTAADLEQVDRLILPGGESTAISRLYSERDCLSF